MMVRVISTVRFDVNWAWKNWLRHSSWTINNLDGQEVCSGGPYGGSESFTYVMIIISSIGGFFLFIVRVGNRENVRLKYGIKGTHCDDVCMHMFCQSCALAHEGKY